MLLPSNHAPRRNTAMPGYTLIEALLLVVILGVVGAAVGQGLTAIIDHAQANDDTALIDAALVTQMETLRATWSTRGTGVQTANLAIGNHTYTLTTDVEAAAPNTTQGIQSTFHSLSVQIAGRTLNSLVSQ